jgi:hypothetical protein
LVSPYDTTDWLDSSADKPAEPVEDICAETIRSTLPPRWYHSTTAKDRVSDWPEKNGEVTKSKRSIVSF